MSALLNKVDDDQARAELEDVLAYHHGDALAAVQSLLADCRNLKAHIDTYEKITGRGYTRGWKPKYE